MAQNLNPGVGMTPLKKGHYYANEAGVIRQYKEPSLLEHIGLTVITCGGWLLVLAFKAILGLFTR